jgi:DNA-binding NarL/FixJ family response regulator
MLNHSYVAYDERAGEWREVHAVRLGGREAQVLELLGKGLAHGLIAQRMSISNKDVLDRCADLLEKLGAADIQHLRKISIQIYHARPHEQV